MLALAGSAGAQTSAELGNAQYVGMVTANKPSGIPGMVRVSFGSCVVTDPRVMYPNLPDTVNWSHHSLITAYHVVKGANYAKCTVQGLTFTAAVYPIDPDSDIAILIAPDSANLKEAAVGDGKSYSDDYSAYGYPGSSTSLLTSHAKVGRRKMITVQEKDDGTWHRYDAVFFGIHLHEGESGGALFDPRGRLAGIIIAGSDSDESWFTPWRRKYAADKPPTPSDDQQVDSVVVDIKP